MPGHVGLIPVVRAVAAHRTVVAAIDALLKVREIDLKEESFAIQEDGRMLVVVIDGEVESETAITAAAGYLKGWFDAKRIGADIL